jgi:DNA-binding transcriptional LysR family regulator
MDIRTLESFVVLARVLNFTKAAEEVSITQPAFSRQITNLENELECSLFKRNKRTVSLTEFGEDFLLYANRILCEYENWYKHLEAMKLKDTKTLTVGLMTDFSDSIVNNILKEYEKNYLNVDLHLKDFLASKIKSRLDQDQIDCAIMVTNRNERLDGYEALDLVEYVIYAAIPKSHPLAEEEYIDLKDLEGDDFVILSPDTGPGYKHIHYLCKQAGFKPNVVNIASSLTSLFTLIKWGIGISLHAKVEELAIPKGITLVPIRKPKANAYAALVWKSKKNNKELKQFIETAQRLII